MKILVTSMLLAGCIAVAFGVAIAARPTHNAAQMGRSFRLETTIPKSFVDWPEMPVQGAQL